VDDEKIKACARRMLNTKDEIDVTSYIQDAKKLLDDGRKDRASIPKLYSQCTTLYM